MATGIKKVGAKMARGVVLKGIAWGTYLDLRDNPANDRVRMTFLDGTLHLMSPQLRHDRSLELLSLLIRSVTRGLGLEAMGIRSTTLRTGRIREAKTGSAKEPDSAYYFGRNEILMRHKTKLDLAVDPPPDLAIEVDNKADSRISLPVYARLGVPEVWRFQVKKRRLWFGRLAEAKYIEIDRSIALPVLTPVLVLEALDNFSSGDRGENAWSIWVEGWAQGLIP